MTRAARLPDRAEAPAVFTPRRGLRRDAAAQYVGMDPDEFKQRVELGHLPKPFRIDNITLWDAKTLDTYLPDIEEGLLPPLPGPKLNGYVYVYGFDRFVKIGWSKEPENRKLGLESGLPLDLTVYAVLAGSVNIERTLHRRFAEYRLRREWFRNEGEVAVWIEAGCPL